MAVDSEGQTRSAHTARSAALKSPMSHTVCPEASDHRHLMPPSTFASLPLLCFCGTPQLHTPHKTTPLQLRYSKGLALLGFLAAHADRVFRRETLAHLLWPDMDTRSGRANLRVVLADLSQQLKQMGLDSLLEVQRDWLALRPTDTVLTDIVALSSESRPEDWQEQALSQDGVWLSQVEEGTSEDFQEWLSAQRLHLDERRRARDASPDDHTQTSTAPAAQPPQICMLTLLRIELGLPLGDEATVPSWHHPQQLERLRHEAGFYGGQLVDHDESGLTFAFGLDSQHTGQRWLALRCACSLAAQFDAGTMLGMGITSGRSLVHPGTQPAVMGWRRRLVTRLALSAETGEIVCDDSLLDLTACFQFRDLGQRRFRGFHQSLRVHGRSLADMPPLMLPPGGDFSGSFFARREQLKRPQALLSAVKPNNAAGLCLSAEPGAGKTRLAWEFAQQVQRQGRLAFWISAMPEAQDIPWRGLHDFFGKLLGGGASASVQLERMERQFQAHLSESARQAILALLGTHSVSQSQHAALADGVSALLRGPGERQVLVVIDDVQWLDQPSAGLLNRVIQRGDPVLWLLTRRLGESHPLHIPFLQEEVLQALDDQAAAAILNSLPDADLLSPEVRQGRIINARGLPLFLLADSVSQEAGSHFSEFCHALLNRLGAARPAMEAAAVLGMLFRHEDLAALCGEQAAAQARDMALASGLLVSRGPQQASFFHPRLREYLLSVIPPQTLQTHAAAAAHRCQDRQEYAEAALLWEQADNLTNARQCWLRAAIRAKDEDDISAACSHCARLKRLGYLDGTEGTHAQLLHAHCLMARDGYGATEAHTVLQAIAQADLSLETLDADMRFNALMLAYLGSSSQGHVDGLEHAQVLHGNASTPAQAMTACWAMGNTLFWLGRFDEARQWLTRSTEIGLQLGRRERMMFFPSDLLVFAEAGLGWAQWLLGDANASRHTLDMALQHASQSPTEQDRCIAHAFNALAAWCASDLQRAILSAQQALGIADAENYVFWRGVAGLLLTLTTAGPGTVIDLATLNRDADAMLVGYRAGTTTALWLAGAALRASGQHTEALATLDQALQASEHYEHRYCRMDLWRLRGLTLQTLGQTDAAHQAWAQAQRIGQEVGATGWLNHWQAQCQNLADPIKEHRAGGVSRRE